MAVDSSVLTYDLTLFFLYVYKYFFLCFAIPFQICVFFHCFLSQVSAYIVTSILCFVSFVTFQAFVPFVTSISNVYMFRKYPPFFCLSVCILHILLIKPIDLTLFLPQVCVSSNTSVTSLCIFYLFFTSLCIHCAI